MEVFHNWIKDNHPIVEYSTEIGNTGHSTISSILLIVSIRSILDSLHVQMARVQLSFLHVPMDYPIPAMASTASSPPLFLGSVRRKPSKIGIFCIQLPSLNSSIAISQPDKCRVIRYLKDFRFSKISSQYVAKRDATVIDLCNRAVPSLTNNNVCCLNQVWMIIAGMVWQQYGSINYFHSSRTSGHDNIVAVRSIKDIYQVNIGDATHCNKYHFLP